MQNSVQPISYQSNISAISGGFLSCCQFAKEYLLFAPLLSAICWIWLCSSTLAADNQKPQAEEAFVNPLEITTPDPLLTQPGSLTGLEKLKLRAALDELNQQAAARRLAGDTKGAFTIWNRELRLRRVLGFQEEIAALGRVGEIAWRENQGLEVNVITRRLQTIGQLLESQPGVDLSLWRALGTAFQQVREPKSAIAVYERVLKTERQQQDIAAAEATLRTIAELRLSWFDYPNAAAAYQELLSLATARTDDSGAIAYLQQLDYVYKKAQQYQQAIAVKQKLAEIYQNQQQTTLLPALQLAIAADYEALRQLQAAFENYQVAYASAWSLEQYSIASDALRRLIALYRSQGQVDEALQTSQILLQSEQRGFNSYGMMTAFEQIGQIHRERGNYTEALAAFQNGLELAQQLKYQETYFTEQIQQINQRLTK